MLNENEKQRYLRHLKLPNVGINGQLKLKSSKIVVIGAGGLGSPVLLYLAAAGIGNMTIVDGDIVDESNLQRQIIFDAHDIGKNKALVATNKIKKLNPLINIHCVNEHLSLLNAEKIIKSCEYLIDCSDNFQTRFLCNDLAYFHKLILIHGSVDQFQGMVAHFKPGVDSCYRCLFPAPPKAHRQNCNETGVLGVTPGLVGIWQAIATIKSILNIGDSQSAYSIQLDLLKTNLKRLKIKKDNECPLCGDHPTILNIKEESPIICPPQFEVASIAESSILLDIREDHEVLKNDFGLKVISKSKIEKDFSLLDRKKSYTFVCTSGRRSLDLCYTLHQLGFSNVYSLKKGVSSALI